MPTIKRFEELEIWQKARELNKQIITICVSPLLSKDFEMVRHIKKTFGSIMDNIAEGFERTGNVEFCQFLSISKGSTGELKSQLYRCIDSNYFGESEFEEMYKLTDEISKMISSFINFLNNMELMGNKFKKQY